MDIDLAAYAAQRIRRCADLLTMSISEVEPHLSESEFTSYVSRVGKAVGEIGVSLLFPIYEYYPQLNPDRQPADVSLTVPPAADTAPPRDAQTAAESIRYTADKVRAELLLVAKTVQEAHPHEAAGLLERIQTVLELVNDVRIQR